MADNLGTLLVAVARGKAEVTLEQLFVLLDLPLGESTLARIVAVGERMVEMGLRLTPNISQGELDTIRRVDFVEPLRVSEETVYSELQRREASDLEFKSSLLYDHKRAANDKVATGKGLRSDEVLHSCLKTIAAFLTSGGGTLYIGVDDDGRIVGISFDFICMTNEPASFSSDGWELTLRDLIKTRFKDGEAINDYVDCQTFVLEGKIVARIQVASRGRLSFLDGKNGCACYRRQGNRTEQVAIEQLEEFIESRRRISG